MNVIEIIRLEESEEGTLGVLKINKEVFCVTLELTDKENHSNISSIPAQQYICKKIISPHHGQVFEVTNVPNRTDILIHKGNTEKDSSGCILLGSYFGGFLNVRKKSVVDSKLAFVHFMNRFRNVDKFHLTIKECF